MDTTKATPRPWKWDGDDLYGAEGRTLGSKAIITTDGGFYGPNPADRELIVAAVNAWDAHRQLVEAARRAHKFPGTDELRELGRALATVDQAVKP